LRPFFLCFQIVQLPDGEAARRFAPLDARKVGTELHFRKCRPNTTSWARLGLRRHCLATKRQVSLRCERRPLRAPFRITGYVFNELDCLIVELGESGAVGRGEAAGVFYLNESVADALDAVAAIKAELENGLDRQGLQRLLPRGGARNAVDCAL